MVVRSIIIQRKIKNNEHLQGDLQKKKILLSLYGLSQDVFTDDVFENFIFVKR